LYGIPLFRKLLNKVAGKKLMETFGGRIRFFGIGGAPIDPEVEKFLIEAHFPYAVGYGLTETSPLIAGSDAFKTKYRAIGPVVRDLEVKLDYSDTTRSDGEILVKGPSVMLGYYNDPEATARVLSDDGWFRTGDLGTYDKDGYLFIKGRAKTMILGPSGENIYPETIEAIINSTEFVEESLVVAREGNKLIALVQLNYERLKTQFHSVADGVSDLKDKAGEILAGLQKEVNKKLAVFSKITRFVEQEEPFVKTPTKKIKRYLYEKSQFPK
jgi:long-chain acyl-CoA synthetase